MNFLEVVRILEAKGIMPKTKPGLEKIRAAVVQKSWFKKLDPKKIITVAGTNGKGTTSACLETLLIAAGKRVGLYTSPHLIQTTERMRVQSIDITEQQFCELYEENLSLIETCELSHFESITLMAADYFFSGRFVESLDYVIFEVGLGGTFDATNIFPNRYAIITALALDHVDILGNTLPEIAKNKFGIIKKNAVVVHQKLSLELNELKNQVQLQTNSQWIETKNFGTYPLNLLGERALINSATALTLFEQMGFNPNQFLSALTAVRWAGRMQKAHLKKYGFDVFLSGDHNPQGVDSLVEIVRSLTFKKIHFILGIGKDKEVDQMLARLFTVPRAQVYLTETPFKGIALADYPAEFKTKALYSDANIENIFKHLQIQRSSHNNTIILIDVLFL